MPQQVIFEDGFPVDPSSPNFAMHEEMTPDLMNCAALWSTHAPATMLFPKYFSRNWDQRPDWLPAAAERLDWHMRSGSKWASYLRALLRALIGHDTVLHENSLLPLATWGRYLQDNESDHQCHDLIGAIQRTLAKRKTLLEKPLAEALVEFTNYLVLIHCHPSETFEVAFRLFREGWIKLDWAEELREQKYAPLLDQSSHYWQGGAVEPKAVRAIARVVEKIGIGEVAATIARVAEKMREQQPLRLTGATMTTLRQILRWAQAVPELKPDVALYKICGLRWHDDKLAELLMKEWVPTMLATLARRPKDRAFSCLEQLSQNPQTSEFPEVATLYTQSMTEVVGGASTVSEGVDGYGLETEADRNLDAMLRASQNPLGRSFSTAPHIDLAVRQAGDDPSAMLRAMNARVRWLKEHEPPVPKGYSSEVPWLFWRCDLGNLYFAILKKKPKLNNGELAELCEIDGLGWLGVAPTSTLFEACEAHVGKHGFDPALSRSMRAWAKTVHGGASAQVTRKAIDWLLWFDMEVPVDPKKCWSGLIHSGLRATNPEKRAPWIALLRNVTFAIAEEPTKKWLKPAPKLLAAIDPAEFRERMRAWFAPFETGQPLGITVAGRHILQALFWYAQLAKDPQIDEVLPAFGQAKWKTKGDRSRTARLLPVWIHTLRERCPGHAIDAIHAYKATGQLDFTGKTFELYMELCQRAGRTPEIEPPPPPPAFDKEEFMRKELGKMMGTIGVPGTQTEEDAVEVTDLRGFGYRINTRDGRIVRISDNKVVRLEIDWSVPPFSPFKHMMDSMDMMNPLQPNYFRVMMCAQILSGSLSADVPIVVDED